MARRTTTSPPVAAAAALAAAAADFDEDTVLVVPGYPGFAAAKTQSRAALPYVTLAQSEYLAPKPKLRERFGVCDCPKYDPAHPENACGEECVNRSLYVECLAGCPSGKNCLNRNFQRGCFAEVEVFDAGRKGQGLRAVAPITSYVVDLLTVIRMCDC